MLTILTGTVLFYMHQLSYHFINPRLIIIICNLLKKKLSLIPKPQLLSKLIERDDRK